MMPVISKNQSFGFSKNFDDPSSGGNILSIKLSDAPPKYRMFFNV
jgi:hypothetical protein